MRRKCLDTYVLIEISEGNQDFIKYTKENIVIPELILIEFYAVLLRRFGEKTAEYWIRKLEPYKAKISFEILIAAIKFKYEFRKQKISLFDAVGYIYSKENNFIFVTGDKEFAKMKNVEFKKNN